MSTQETYLQQIADAIREKDGTTEPIQAKTYPERILAIETGGGGRYGNGIGQISIYELYFRGGRNYHYAR